MTKILKGLVKEIEHTEEFIVRGDTRYEKCIFNVLLIDFAAAARELA